MPTPEDKPPDDGSSPLPYTSDHLEGFAKMLREIAEELAKDQERRGSEPKHQ